MNVVCPECRSVFRVDPVKVPAGGTRARCAVCGGVMAVEAPGAFLGPTQPGRWATPAAPSPAAPAAAMPAAAPARPMTPTPAAGAPASSPAMTPAVPGATPSAVPSGAPAPWPRVTPAPAPSTPPPAFTPPAPLAAPGAPPRVSGGRQINPFLSNDPHQKAKRLARALVSDIVAYHPQLRDQALREGTLKQLFRDEIKKSYEEYVDQVGKEFADGTGHFQEALNDILAGGRKVF